MMNSSFVRGFAVASLLCAAISCFGCAPAYHSYSGCNIDCQYCPPPPLPWNEYPPCVCHSKPAEQWLGANASSAGVGHTPSAAGADEDRRPNEPANR